MSDGAGDFGAKLDLALKVLNISRGQLAQEARVDKSLVSRWTRGLAAPRGHNLAQLTDIVRVRAPGFTQLAWDLPLEGFAKAIGAPLSEIPAAPAAEPTGWLAGSRRQSAIETQREGHAYPGLYVSFRQAFRNTGDLVAELIVMWREGERLLFRQYDPAFSHVGELFILRHQLFSVGEDDQRVDGLMYYLLNGVTGQKAIRLDGLQMTVLNDRYRTPTAAPVVLQRLADLEDERPPPDEALNRIVTRLREAFEAGTIGERAGPEVAAALAPVIGAPRPDGGLDRVLRMPSERSLCVSELDWTGAVEADIRRLRAWLLDDETCFPIVATAPSPTLPARG